MLHSGLALVATRPPSLRRHRPGAICPGARTDFNIPNPSRSIKNWSPAIAHFKLVHIFWKSVWCNCLICSTPHTEISMESSVINVQAAGTIKQNRSVVFKHWSVGLQPLRSRSDGVEGNCPTSGSGQSLILSPPMWVYQLTHAINMYINNSFWTCIAQYFNNGVHVCNTAYRTGGLASTAKELGLSFIWQ
jgi:hypothetical protein